MRNDDNYFSDEEFREILDDYEQAVKSGQPLFMDADDLADIADYYQMNGRYEEARQAINSAAEMEPHSLGVLNYQIHDALQEGEIDKAQELLDSIMEQESPEYIYDKAEILIARDKVEEADLYLREKLNDTPPDEYQDYVLDVANLYTDYGLNDKAMEWMMRARQENTEDFKELMARTLFGLGKYDDSERIFNELIDQDPFQKRYWHALASAQYMKEDYSASISSSEYAIAIDPADPEGIIAKANALFRLENFEEALKYYERYTQLEPDDEFGLLHQGTCLINLGRCDEALEQLHKAADIAPADSDLLVDIYHELAFTHSEKHELEQAMHYIDLTDALDCDHDDLYVIRGHILLENDRLEEAEKMFRKALQQSGNNPHIMLRILVSLYDNKYVEATYHMFRKLFSSVSDDWTDGYAYMALCCWDTGRTDEFMHYLKIACDKNPNETRLALSGLFPEDVAPKDYYSYMIEKIKK